MDYVSGTSDAALNSSSASDVSLHQIQRQREGFSPSAEQPGLKKTQILLNPSSERTIHPAQGKASWRRWRGPSHPPSTAGSCQRTRGCSIGTADLAGGQPPPHLPITHPTLFPAPTATAAAAEDPGRWQTAVAPPWPCPGAAPSFPASSQPVF